MKKYDTNLFGQKLNVSQAIDSNAEGKGTILQERFLTGPGKQQQYLQELYLY